MSEPYVGNGPTGAAGAAAEAAAGPAKYVVLESVAVAWLLLIGVAVVAWGASNAGACAGAVEAAASDIAGPVGIWG
jgi:hypothetical protein